MIRNTIFFLMLTLMTACGSQKKYSNIADQVVKDYLESTNVVVINEPSNQNLLKAVQRKYEFYKNYNLSSVHSNSSDTLKHIFSKKNLSFFKIQLNNPTKWSEKKYIEQTIITEKERNAYKNETIYSLSQPVITHNKKFALIQSSSFHQRFMTGSEELLIFIKRKDRWVIYKRFEIELL